MATHNAIDLLIFSEEERMEAHQLPNRWGILQPVQTEQAAQISQGRSRWERHFQNEQGSNMINLHEPQLIVNNNAYEQNPESSEESVIGSDWGARLPAGSHRWEIRAESQSRAQLADRSQRVSNTSRNSSSWISENPIMGTAQVETVTNYMPTMQITQRRRSAVTIKSTRNRSLTESEYVPNIYAQRNEIPVIPLRRQTNAVDGDETASPVSASIHSSGYDTVFETSRSVHHSSQPAHSQPIRRIRMHKSVPPPCQRTRQEHEGDRNVRRPTLEERYLPHNIRTLPTPNQTEYDLSTRLVGQLASAIREAGWGSTRKVVKPEKFEIGSEISFTKFLEKFERYCYYEISEDKYDWIRELGKFLKGEIADGYKDIKKGTKTYEALIDALETWYKRRRGPRAEGHRNLFHEATLRAGENAYTYAVRLEALAKAAYGCRYERVVKRKFLLTAPQSFLTILRIKYYNPHRPGSHTSLEGVPWEEIVDIAAIELSTVRSMAIQSEEDKTSNESEEEIGKTTYSSPQRQKKSSKERNTKNNRVMKLSAVAKTQETATQTTISLMDKLEIKKENKDNSRNACFGCGSTSHFVANCPQRGNCQTCGDWGHGSRSCPQNNFAELGVVNFHRQPSSRYPYSSRGRFRGGSIQNKRYYEARNPGRGGNNPEINRNQRPQRPPQDQRRGTQSSRRPGSQEN